jgi:holo-[acyl-carrier protein] synthase
VLGIGTDLVDIDRFRGVLDRTPGLVERLFRTEEQEYAARAADPTPRLAVRFAAKEATLKAMGCGLGSMKLVDIEVVRHGDGPPELVLHDTAARRAHELGAARFLVSLTHTDHVAQAVVVALRS